MSIQKENGHDFGGGGGSADPANSKRLKNIQSYYDIASIVSDSQNWLWNTTQLSTIMYSTVHGSLDP